MPLFDRVRKLTFVVDRLELEPLAHPLGFMTRRTTVIHLHGAGQEGVGEDVSYEEDLQLAFTDDVLPPLAGEHTLESFSALVAHQPGYRPWGLESAALDLALRQAGASLAEALGRVPQPIRYVVSQKAVRELRTLYPTLRFKLDASDSWTEEVVAELAATRAVDVVDLKGLYEGEWVDATPSAELYRRVAEAFPEAWLEDPRLTEETRPVLEPHRDRITWDAPLHSVADVQERAIRAINSKPSRFGSLRELISVYEHCEREGIAIYGGGQGEVECGRGQIQYLASLFHPDTPNDVAPSGYNDPAVPDGMPTSPMDPVPSEIGFRWAE
jgi:L-alanine-DL-glutamate epimerase-like enolase superfamily enzyme